VNPDGLTLRELWWMNRGRSKETWQVVSTLLAQIHNSNLWGDGAESLSPDDCNPLVLARRAKRGRQRMMISDFSFMARFCKTEEGK
jgi:hypothetical protein